MRGVVLLAAIGGVGSLSFYFTFPDSRSEWFTYPNRPPYVANFRASNRGPGFWQVSGLVYDEDPAGNEVTLGGLVSAVVTVEPDGYFSYSQYIPSGVSGTVTAQARDSEGLESMVVSDFIFN